MGEYTVLVTIVDNRNGEVVGEREIELDECSLTEEGIEQLEDFLSIEIGKYEQDVYA